MIDAAATDWAVAADWAALLDRFERTIWPVFKHRGYSKATAATIYFTRLAGVDGFAWEPDD